jgi:hypothetical protein
VRADPKLTVFVELETSYAAAERPAQINASTRIEKELKERPRKESSTLLSRRHTITASLAFRAFEPDECEALHQLSP